MNYNLENTTEIGCKSQVVLDGVVQQYCVEADTDENYVVRYARHEDGNFVISGEEIQLERVFGKSVKVEITAMA